MVFCGFSSLKEKELNDINKNKVSQGESFAYTWARVNALLREMPGSDGLTWDKGVGVTSSTQQEKSPDGKMETFRYFLGYTEAERQYILIIYNCTTENINYYKPSPSSEEQMDPWLNHDPYKSKANQQQAMFNTYNNDRRYRTNRPTISSDIGSTNDFSSSIDKARDVL